MAPELASERNDPSANRTREGWLHDTVGEFLAPLFVFLSCVNLVFSDVSVITPLDLATDASVMNLELGTLYRSLMEKAVVLGFIGSLPSHRGGKQILEVAEKLNSKIKNLYVLIVGYDNKILEPQWRSWWMIVNSMKR